MFAVIYIRCSDTLLPMPIRVADNTLLNVNASLSRYFTLLHDQKRTELSIQKSGFTPLLPKNQLWSLYY